MKKLLILIVSLVLCANIAFAKQDNESKYEKLRIFARVMAIVENNYVDNVSNIKLINSAIKGMVSSLDPHSSYMTKDDFKELNIETTGKFGGLGIEVTLKDGVLTVVAPIEDTPAYRAGIKAQDVILKVDDKSTLGMTLQDAVKIMRGKPGTKIKLTIMRENQKKPIEVEITRAIIHVKSVKFKKIDNIGYIKISKFQDKTTKEVTKALSKLKKIDGLVIDLRNDPGGLLKEAIGVSDLFVKKGVIVSIRGRNKDESQYFYAHNDKTEPNYPIVVLINAGTASASEIVAGCLKDDKRAIVMGIKSFGKGSVQSVIALPDGSALRLTTAKYYTPSGKSIQAIGIEPDIVVKQAKLEEENNDKYRLREEDLAHHLMVENIKEKYSKDKKKKEDKKLKDDYQLLRAVDLVKALVKAEHIVCTKQ
jgi:carboxyl-terminal processing protease